LATQTPMQGQSMSQQGGLSSQAVFTAHAIDAKSIQSIQLPDGWHNVQQCEVVQFTVGQAQSPIANTSYYPALRYTNESGKQVTTPLSKILSFSQEQQTSGRTSQR
jgi:hypothetical protein